MNTRPGPGKQPEQQTLIDHKLASEPQACESVTVAYGSEVVWR